MVDDGLTFGTNNHAGVCVHFHDKVPSPLRRVSSRTQRSSSLSLTVAFPLSRNLPQARCKRKKGRKILLQYSDTQLNSLSTTTGGYRTMEVLGR